MQITYDVETLGSAKKMELPLVVGILADLLGETPSADLLKQRKFVQIDRDTFDDFMGKLEPTHTVKGKAGPAGLTFKKLADFEPLQIVKQVPKLNKLLRERQRLVDVVAKLSGNDSLNTSFNEVFKDGSEARKTKNGQVAQQRLPFEKAFEAAKNLTRPAKALMSRLGAVASVIRAAQKVYCVDGACDELEQLLPGEEFTALQAAAGTTRAAGYREKLQSFLGEDAGTTMADQLEALVSAVNKAPAPVQADVTKALDVLKAGPAKNLKAVTELEPKVTAFLADPTKKGELDAAVKSLKVIVENAGKISDALKKLEVAASVDPADQAADQAVLQAAKTRLQETSLTNADELFNKAEAFAKKPSNSTQLQSQLRSAFPTPLSGELEKLSQAQVLLKHQQAITDVAEARVRQANRFMEPKSKEKTLAAHREACQVLETAKRVATLVKEIDEALKADIAPKKLGSLLASAEALHGAVDTALSETQQQLEAFKSAHP
ncbi:type VI secretion system contractile sheath small subunit [Corallococcus exiguus]|nr:type VI secretion system contractile sheath small subunit [Corallococcus exiguus]